MSDLPYKSWKNTPLDPTPPAPGSPASKLPTPATRPVNSLFKYAPIRNKALAELMLASAVLGMGWVWWRQQSAESERGSDGGDGRGKASGTIGVERGEANTPYQNITVVRATQ